MMFNREAIERIQRGIRRTEQIPPQEIVQQPSVPPPAPYHDFVYVRDGSPISGLHDGLVSPYYGQSGTFVSRTDVPVWVRTPASYPLSSGRTYWGRWAPAISHVSGLRPQYVVDDPLYLTTELCAIDGGSNSYDWSSGSCQTLLSGGTAVVPTTGGSYTGAVTFVSGSALTINLGGTLTIGGNTTYSSGSTLTLNDTTVTANSGTTVNLYDTDATFTSGSTLHLTGTAVTVNAGSTAYNNTTLQFTQTTLNLLSGNTENLTFPTITQSGGSLALANVNLTFVGSTASGLITSGMLASGLLADLTTSTKTMTLYSGPIQATTATTIFDVLDSGGVHGSLGIRQMDSKGFTGTLVGVNMFGQSGGVSVNPLASGDVVGFNIDEQSAGINCKPPFNRVILYLTATTSGAVHNTWLSKL